MTTGQVAKILHVATRTVNIWIDTGRLRGFRVPGTKHRRVLVGDLEAFIREYNQPFVIPEEFYVRD